MARPRLTSAVDPPVQDLGALRALLAGGRRLRWRTAVYALALLSILVFQVEAIWRQSFTGDEPYHLLAAHQALLYGDNTLNVEHPPLVKLIAALPFLAESEPLAPRQVTVPNALAESLSVYRSPAYAHRLQVRTRLVLLFFFALPFLVVCFLLGRALGGNESGLLLALAIGLSFGALPYLSLVTTDAAAALGWVLALWALFAHLQRWRWRYLVYAGVGLGIAVASKHNGILLVPVVIAAAMSAGASRRRTIGAITIVLALGFATPYLAYVVANHGYDPAQGQQALLDYAAEGRSNLRIDGQLNPYLPVLSALTKEQPELAQWLTGILAVKAQNRTGIYPSYAFGTVRSEGRWWYHLSLLAVKTPIVTLLALLAGAIAFLGSVSWRWPRSPRGRGVAILTMAAILFLGTAMLSNYNGGFRHLFPLLPVLYAPAALWLANRRWLGPLFSCILLVECVAVAPLWLSATSTWWLGAHNPTRFAFGIDNLEYRQNLIILADELAERGIRRVQVINPMLAREELRAYVPQAALKVPGEPLVEGWCLVNVLLESYTPAVLSAPPHTIYRYDRILSLVRAWEPLLHRATQGQDHGYLAGTYHLYYLRAEDTRKVD